MIPKQDGESFGIVSPSVVPAPCRKGNRVDALVLWPTSCPGCTDERPKSGRQQLGEGNHRLDGTAVGGLHTFV